MVVAVGKLRALRLFAAVFGVQCVLQADGARFVADLGEVFDVAGLRELFFEDGGFFAEAVAADEGVFYVGERLVEGLGEGLQVFSVGELVAEQGDFFVALLQEGQAQACAQAGNGVLQEGMRVCELLPRLPVSEMSG